MAAGLHGVAAVADAQVSVDVEIAGFGRNLFHLGGGEFSHPFSRIAGDGGKVVFLTGYALQKQCECGYNAPFSPHH